VNNWIEISEFSTIADRRFNNMWLLNHGTVKNCSSCKYLCQVKWLCKTKGIWNLAW